MAIETFVHDCHVRGMSPVTVRRYEYALKLLERFFEKPLADVSKVDIGRYVEACRTRGMKSKSIANDLNTLSSYFEHLIFAEMATANPVIATKKRYLSAYKSDGEKGHKE